MFIKVAPFMLGVRSTGSHRATFPEMIASSMIDTIDGFREGAKLKWKLIHPIICCMAVSLISLIVAALPISQVIGLVTYVV